MAIEIHCHKHPSLLEHEYRACENLPFLAAVAALSACSTSSAAEPEMTKIVSRAIGPQILPGSFAAKPKTLYLAARKYARAEEEIDVEHGIRSLIITNEPDIWIINLVDKTGRHLIDPGPTFDVHSPIFWTGKPEGQPDPDKEFEQLEFGNEIQFFREHGARDVGMRRVDGKACSGLTIKTASREVTLLFDPKSGKPYQIDIGKDGKLEGSIRYVEYRTGLPFQKSLFEPPKGIKIEEADANKAGSVGVVGRYKDLAEWAEQDNRNSREFASDLRSAHSAKEVATALRASARRQQKTTDDLIELVRAYPELRNRPKLGLDDEGLRIWQQSRPDAKRRQDEVPEEVIAISEQMHRSNEMLSTNEGRQSSETLQKYRGDPEVMSAAKELGQVLAENRNKLLEAFR